MNDGLIKPGAVQVAGRLEGEMTPCIYCHLSKLRGALHTRVGAAFALEAW